MADLYVPNVEKGEPDLRLAPVWVLSEGDCATIYGGLFGPETDEAEADSWFSWWLSLPEGQREELKDAASDAIGYVWADALDSAFRLAAQPEGAE